MASFTNKEHKDFYKDVLHTSNSNTGISTTIKQITCGDGDTTSLYLSTRNAKIQPASDTTTNTVIYDSDGNALVTVDSTNDLVKAGIGQHIVNTQFKTFGLYDFSPTIGYHSPLVCHNTIDSSGAAAYTGFVNGANWGGSGANPVTSLTVASTANMLATQLWLLQSNITLDEIQYIMASDAASTISLQVMQYDVVTGSGSTAGDLSNGTVLAQTGSDSSSLSPVTTGADRTSNGTLTINTANVDSAKAIVIFAEVSDTDDMTVQVNIKYHLR